MRRCLVLLTFVVLTCSTWLGFTIGQVAASEPGVTVEKNIVYVHVPAAICACACFVVLLVAAIAYLKTVNQKWDYLGAASAEAAFVFATALNATGCIFARAFWGCWWTPSPRLVSSAVLWFLAAAYLILRAGIPDRRRRARFCAVFGIIAFLDVPMVFATARFTKDIHIANVEFENAWQGLAFGLGILGTILLGVQLIWLKTDIFRCKARLEEEPSA